MNSNTVEFDDMQGLVRFAHRKLPDACFLLLEISDAAVAKQWLATAPVSSALKTDTPATTALQIAFSAAGLRAMGLDQSLIGRFSDEFINGLSGDESRSRRLGDVGKNAPQEWSWGSNAKQVHVLLLLYALNGNLDAWRKTVEGRLFSKAFKIVSMLSTENLGNLEPFGFTDGISQPDIDWQRQQSTDAHARDGYSNLLSMGEILLGYPNEYGQYTARPLLDPTTDELSTLLPTAEDRPQFKDFGRNGSYLVLRQLSQDVPGFWRFIDQTVAADPEKREQLAAAMVGRHRDGTPLITPSKESIAGLDDPRNHFTYETDPKGLRCPIGAHIRRANPRTGDLPAAVSSFLTRLKMLLGFGQQRPDEDLLASSRFHRLLRRGRSYGPLLTPEEAIKPDAPTAERGLHFICLVANIARQFEFVQNAWMMNSKFGGVQQERDALLGHRASLLAGEATNEFHQPDAAGPVQKTCALPQFITVRGGGYFLMPGLRALKYLAAMPTKQE